MLHKYRCFSSMKSDTTIPDPLPYGLMIRVLFIPQNLVWWTLHLKVDLSWKNTTLFSMTDWGNTPNQMVAHTLFLHYSVCQNKKNQGKPSITETSFCNVWHPHARDHPWKLLRLLSWLKMRAHASIFLPCQHCLSLKILAPGLHWEPDWHNGKACQP